MRGSLITLIRIIEPFYQRHNSAFPRPTTTNNSNSLSSGEEYREISKDNNIWSRWVAESNILEFYIAINLRQALSI